MMVFEEAAVLLMVFTGPILITLIDPFSLPGLLIQVPRGACEYSDKLGCDSAP